VPVILACGMKEVEDSTVTVRRLGEKQTSIRPVTEIISELAQAATPPDLL